MWEDEYAVGPTIHTHANVRAIIVTQYHVEWLDYCGYSNHHIAAFLTFAERQTVNDLVYMSARLSMELSGSASPVVGVGEVSSPLSDLT